MNSFFVGSDAVAGNFIRMEGADVNHMKNVLRMKIGEKVSISAGNNTDYICEIKQYEEDGALLEIVEKLPANRELSARIYLFQGLPKADKMELIIQKCVELGVYEIIPVATKRCVVKLDDKKAQAKTQRWQAISESAAKQSKRELIPKVNEVMSFSKALEYAKSLDIAMIPYEMCENMDSFRECLAKTGSGKSIGFFIGPEGGFDIEEVEKAKQQGIVPVSLGRRILRTETAGLCVMSIIMYHLEIMK